MIKLEVTFCGAESREAFGSSGGPVTTHSARFDIPDAHDGCCGALADISVSAEVYAAIKSRPARKWRLTLEPAE